ncbi:MAG: hypothetical protein ACRC3K_08840, partial [Plesiomonas sp.]
MFKVFTADELSNEAYHADTEYVSGTALCTIHAECPAKWFFGDKKETAALNFGIASHAALLEPSKFDAEFVRGISKDDYPQALTSDAAIGAWLKERGIKGYSGKKFQDLYEMVLATGENPQIWKVIEQEFIESVGDRVIVKPVDFDCIEQMRATV